MEKRDLPGNDASWYRALLDEQGTEGAPTEPSAVRQLLLPVEESGDQPSDDASVDLDDESPDQVVDAMSPEGAEAIAESEDAEATAEPESEVATDDSAGDEPTDDEDEVEAAVEPTTEPEPPDLVVQSPQLSGDTEPVHFPDDARADEAADEPDTPAAVAAVPEIPKDDGRIDNTSEMIGQLWTARDPETPLDDWAPDEMDSKMSSSRPFRWTSVIGILAVIGLIVVGLILLPSITRNRADVHRDMMTAALWDLRSELPDTQTSLRIATEPETTVAALNDLSTQLTVLTAKASTVDDAGRADLPTPPPLTSSDPIDELAPIQQRLEPLATTAQTIQRRIGNLVEYRSLISGFMVLPELPTEADGSTQADLRVMLASAQAESASILSDLPSDVSLSAHQEIARSINDTFADWLIDYLEALRAEDPVTAEALVAELTDQLAQLDAEMVTPLAQIRRQTDADLIDLARAIDEVMDLANGTEPPP